MDNGSNMHLSKIDPAPFGMITEMFLVHFEPVVTPWKSPTCLENGPFWTKNGLKVGQKSVFTKMDHSGWSNKGFKPILSPW